MTTTSLKAVINRIASLRIMDSTYLDDLLEWLPQGMEKLKTKMQMEITSKDLEVTDHYVPFPCGYNFTEAVETLSINGEEVRMRLREGSDKRYLATISETTEESNLFISDPVSVQRVYIPTDQITDEGVVIDEGYYTEYKFVGYRSLVPYDGKDIRQAKTIHVSPPYYIPQPGGMQTSFAEGKIRLHYRKIPVDKEGYPLIPNHEDYLTALEWYGLSCIIAAGYQHPIFDYRFCYEKFETHGRRAINSITYPTPEKMERIVERFVRLIPPINYYETFETNTFKSPEQLH